VGSPLRRKRYAWDCSAVYERGGGKEEEEDLATS
jgi:hypothetical protein